MSLFLYRACRACRACRAGRALHTTLSAHPTSMDSNLNRFQSEERLAIMWLLKRDGETFIPDVSIVSTHHQQIEYVHTVNHRFRYQPPASDCQSTPCTGGPVCYRIRSNAMTVTPRGSRVLSPERFLLSRVWVLHLSAYPMSTTLKFQPRSQKPIRPEKLGASSKAVRRDGKH